VLSAGTETTATDDRGGTASQLAAGRGHADIAKRLGH
jgi:hypothetical protein